MFVRVYNHRWAAQRKFVWYVNIGICTSSLTLYICVRCTGMFIGILLAMASFVVSYSRLQSVSCASLQTSTVIRTFEVRDLCVCLRHIREQSPLQCVRCEQFFACIILDSPLI